MQTVIFRDREEKSPYESVPNVCNPTSFEFPGDPVPCQNTKYVNSASRRCKKALPFRMDS